MSAGSAVALQIAMQYPHRVGSIAIYDGITPEYSRSEAFQTAGNRTAGVPLTFNTSDITHPVLVVWQEGDQVIPIQFGFDFARDLGRELVVFPDPNPGTVDPDLAAEPPVRGNHHPHRVYPKRMVEVTLDFFNRKNTPASLTHPSRSTP
jgi:pimeloyl-ACP methyl ester carboxylesterase